MAQTIEDVSTIEACGGLDVTQRAVSDLKPYPSNARTHSNRQIRQIAASIKEFGFLNPVLVDSDGQIIAGHGRVEAAKLLGRESVPTIRLEHLNDAQKRAYIIADNRLAELAGWDQEILAIELQALTNIDVDFDVEVTGFEMPEIDLLIGDLAGDEPDAADDVPDINNDDPPVSRPGDLWWLGEHRLLCGDATKMASFDALLGRRRAQMVFTDPPYNVPVDRHVCGLGSVRHEDFAMASGEMSEAEFTAFLERVLSNLTRFSIDGSVHYVFMDWRHMAELLAAGKAVYSDLLNLCVWNKSNGGMGSLYRSKHELIFVFKNGTKPHINNVRLGRHGRNRTNVWDYAGVNSLKADRMEELAMHPTVKPVALVADAMLDCSERRGVVLDPFCGSGTTIMAAERVGRRAFAMELEPRYVDVAVQRWQAYTGDSAVHDSSELSFDDEATRRRVGGLSEVSRESADVNT